MSSFDKKDFIDRVNKLSNTNTQTDEELADRFQKVFNTQPIATQKNYHIPTTAYTDDIDEEIEKMLQESDEENDGIDDYIYSVLDSSSKVQQKMDGFQKIFLGSETVDDETDDLIKRLQQENALDQKYQQFKKSRDDDMEKRYHALKSNPIVFTNDNNNNRPKGSIPKPLHKEELHDEMDDWCCICNEDATIECEGCEEDNKYCTDCFFHTHQSESADYEATKHKSKRYIK